MKDAEIEQKFLQLVFTTDADVTPAALAFFARCPIKQATEVLDRLVSEGTLRLESDEHGELTYVYPRRKRLETPPPTPPPISFTYAEPRDAEPPPRKSRALVPATTTSLARGYAVNPGAAAVLSMVWPGAGQVYAGRVAAGIGWMLAIPLGYSLFIIPGLVLHMLCILSAVNSARETNLRGGL